MRAGGRQTALPRRRRAAATISTRTQRALPCRRGDPPARPGARAGRIGSSARLAPRTPSTTRRHSNWCRASHAGGPARYVDGTRRLPISPLIDTYLVPEAPQGARSDPIPPLATSSAIGHKGGYDTVKIDVTQTPRPTRPTTAIPVRAEEVPPRSTMARKPQRAAAGKLEPLRAPIQPALHPA